MMRANPLPRADARSPPPRSFERKGGCGGAAADPPPRRRGGGRAEGRSEGGGAPHDAKPLTRQFGAPRADSVRPRSARRSAHPRTRRHSALMRALRLLHRDLPDLCHARRRARQPARPHLSHQGSAGDRAQDRGGRRLADRPLPLLPLLRDDLPLGRRLSPARRSRAGAGSRRPIAARLPTASCALSSSG